MPFAIYVVIFAALALQSDLTGFMVCNLLVQLAVFVVGACLPAHRTGFMSYVDVAWPWGLALVGVQVLAFGGLDSPVAVATAAIYLLMGMRMGAWALRFMVFKRLPGELPRYQYQRRRWERDGSATRRCRSKSRSWSSAAPTSPCSRFRPRSPPCARPASMS
ncbi:hypothetical protein [Streptomyces sp. NBC_00199]|uniref:hypothetical protein n=1 Tax=Streptomyces sp. NBC_00199 TaxID=2975678 RepID=UPI002258D282|nr:hypothetical protein [Streptomyces sp. NBC_00199]MCX5264446.1 DUF1295 domain-containing protein [Streptomyces sp. NBC_00199]MCX5270001.1 DUF1295 domain-containing protein [Streptomyces sp. NBC_00199]